MSKVKCMINYSIGGFWNKKELLMNLIQFLEEYPNCVKTDVVFKSSFDSFPNVIWNGGRVVVGVPSSKAEMVATIKYFNDKNIGLNFTFTNSLIRKVHLSDYLGNMILELAHNEMNSVVLHSKYLYEYLEKKFPKYKKIWLFSQTSG